MRVALRALLGVTASAVLLSGCSAVADPSLPGAPTASVPTASSSVVSPSSPAPSPIELDAPTASPSPTVKVDKKSSLAVNPVNYEGSRVVVARFSTPEPGAPVQLQREVDGEWETVAVGSQNKNGRVEFLTPFGNDSYRAVAEVEAGKSVATPTTSASKQWKKVFGEEFKGSKLGKSWAVRYPDAYGNSRLCSASQPEMIKVSGGELKASVRAADSKRAKQVRQNAAKVEGVAASKACPHGVYDLGMVGTQGRFDFRYGIVAVRAKFPKDDGVHAAAWMQPVDSRGVEIDFAETFGLKRGIQHKLHYTKNGKKESAGEILKSIPAVKNEAWWDEYHVFSMEWTSKEYVFRVDGQETWRTSKGLSKGNQYLILSLLASDYALKRIDDDTLPATFNVDWIRVWQEK